MNKDFSDLHSMNLRKGKGWPDANVLETLPKIINNLNNSGSATGFESWMIIKNSRLEVIGDAGFKGFNYETGSADIGYGVIKQERDTPKKQQLRLSNGHFQMKGYRT